MIDLYIIVRVLTEPFLWINRDYKPQSIDHLPCMLPPPPPRPGRFIDFYSIIVSACNDSVTVIILSFLLCARVVLLYIVYLMSDIQDTPL